jgi:hypothetical protein
MNIVTGTHADEKMNVDKAKDIGVAIMTSMTDQSPFEYKFKKSDQATNLCSKTALQISGEQVQIDPDLLFQCLIIAARSVDEANLFKYELCSYPAALFDSPFNFREPQKHLFADAIWSTLSDVPPLGPCEELQFVLDGGALLHRIPWAKGFPTFNEICKMYTEYITKKYSKAVVIFDGYSTSSTKDLTHRRRAKGKRAKSDIHGRHEGYGKKRSIFVKP